MGAMRKPDIRNGIYLSEQIDYFRISFSARSALTIDIKIVTFVWLCLFYCIRDLDVSVRAKLFESLWFRTVPTTRLSSAAVCLLIYWPIDAI